MCILIIGGLVVAFAILVAGGLLFAFEIAKKLGL
jgi:hypothetical protein